MSNLGMSVKEKAKWDNLRTKALEFSKDLGVSYLDLAEVLHTLWSMPVAGSLDGGAVFQLWGYKDFEDYAEAELNIQRRRARRLVFVWHLVKEELGSLDGDLRRRFKDLGWSKVRELARLITVENAEYWIRAAETMDYRSLVLAVQAELAKKGVEL
jgi:hypothetical protein